MSALDDLKMALGPLPSPAVASLRFAGFVAWDANEIPETYRGLVHEKSTWAAYSTRAAVEKNPDVMAHMDKHSEHVDVETGRLFFDTPEKGPWR
jgi:hypothetical protein